MVVDAILDSSARGDMSGSFYDKGLEGASHHAVIPNVNTVDDLREIWPHLSTDEEKLFDVIARAYLAAVMSDFRYRQTTAMLAPRGIPDWSSRSTGVPLCQACQAYYMDRYGYDVLPLALRLLAGETLPSRTAT